MEPGGRPREEQGARFQGAKQPPVPPGKECGLAGGLGRGAPSALEGACLFPSALEGACLFGDRSRSPSIPLRRSLEILRVCSAFQRASSITRRLLSAAPRGSSGPPRSFRGRKVGLPPPSAGPFPHSRQPPETRQPCSSASPSPAALPLPSGAGLMGRRGGGQGALLAWSQGVFGQWEGEGIGATGRETLLWIPAASRHLPSRPGWLCVS